MKKLVGLLLALVVSAAGATAVRGQTRADTAAVLLDAARRLDADGQRAGARAVLNLLKRDYAGTPAAASAVAMLSGPMSSSGVEESGRVELMVWGTTYGLWLGVATPLLFNANDPAPFGVGLLAGAPLGFFTARQYVKSHPDLTIGQARAITFGGTWGTWQGAGWTAVLGDKTDEFCSGPGDCFTFETGPSTQKLMAGMLAGGLVGIGTGALIARKPISAGVASTVSASGLWGSWFGVAAGTMAGLDGDDLFATTLLAGDVTVAAAGLLAPKWKPSVNRVRLVSLSGLVGGVAGGGVVLIAQPDDEKVAVAIPLATSIAGLMLGAHATRHYDDANRQGDALINVHDGKVGAGLPEMYPVLRRDPRDARGRLQPALGITLLSAHF